MKIRNVTLTNSCNKKVVLYILNNNNNYYYYFFIFYFFLSNENVFIMVLDLVLVKNNPES